MATLFDDRDDAIDAIAEAIQDAEDCDANSYTFARAIVRLLEAHGIWLYAEAIELEDDAP
jgi:hypothetical protein